MLIFPITDQGTGAGYFKIDGTRYAKGSVNISPVAAGPYITLNYAYDGRDIGFGLRSFFEFSINGATPATRQELLDWADEHIYLKGDTGAPGASYPGITQDRTLQNAANAVTVDWNAGKLKRADGSTAVDWQASTLNAPTGAVSINWNTRQFFDGANVAAIDLNQRRLLRADGQRSIDWSNNRNSIRDDQNYMSIIWGYSSYFDSVPGKYTGNRLLLDGKTYYGRGAVSVAYHDRVLFDENENPAASWNANARNLQQYNGNITLDWNNLQLLDSYAAISADWGQRNLRDASNQYAVKWGDRALYSGNQPVLDWEYLTLNTVTGNLAVDWGARKLISESNNTMLEWDTVDENGQNLVTISSNASAALNLNGGFVDGLLGSYGDYSVSGEIYVRINAVGGYRVVRIPYVDVPAAPL